MHTLTNHHRDFELLNLARDADGRGPYLVRQWGIPPRALSLEEDCFLLRDDGTWVLNFRFCALPKPDQARFLFADIRDIYHLLETLPSVPRVEAGLPADLTREEILAACRRTQDNLCVRIREAPGVRLTRR
ncbi:MAG: hypothetical protein FJ387_21430 [Verrucomicrobia bacterium]|nr:hypothetical protein [Verrucomicrobiota bacterium]